MSMIQETRSPSLIFNWGMFWLAVATLAAVLFFIDGVDALLIAWQKPEYSHGPLIPILSGLLFLRQLKEVPTEPGPKRDRWAGVAVLLLAIFLGALGKLANISDIVAYATIVWVGAILLISFGWKTGKHFWPPVLHLVYMLPLPDVLYYKVSTYLQFISSELGVYFLQLLNVPVFLDGNIIDLGIMKLHVAEACSGLRYLFPILSFSYIFAVLYKGPVWHKAVLLISAAPITVFMNSVRIAVGGLLVQELGVEWLEGFSHFFEGWVIFLICVVLLFLLARIMLLFHPQKPKLVDALDLDTDGLMPQFLRLRYVYPSPAMITAALLTAVIALGWFALPSATRCISSGKPSPSSRARSTSGNSTAWPKSSAPMSSASCRPTITARHISSIRILARPSASFLPGTRIRAPGAFTLPKSACPAAAGKSPGWSGRISRSR